MTGLSAGIAYWWFRPADAEEGDSAPRGAAEDGPVISFTGWAALMGLFWAIQILLFTTFFTNPVDGLATGVVGSLGYWLKQQEVQRGSQPWYYYMMQGVLYEFLPLALSAGGLAALCRPLYRRLLRAPAGKEEETAEPENGSEEEDGETERRESDVRPLLAAFLAWWVVGSWLAYSYAGEKMPWLMTHMAQPMAIFGGWWGARMLVKVDWQEVRRGQHWWALALPPALLFALAALFSSLPVGGRELQSLARTTRFIFAFAVSGGVFYLVAFAIGRMGLRLALRLAGVAAAAMLLLLTVRFSYLLTYVNYDMATEYLVYAHASPDVKRALAEIETISERTVGEREIKVSYDDDVAWPMTWYMRFFPNHIFYGANPSNDAMGATVILVGSKNYDKVEPYVARDYVSRTYRLVWWPEESYKGEWNGESSRGLTLGQILGVLTDPERRSRLWQIVFFRNHPDRTLTEWPHRHEFRMYVRRDVANVVWDLNVVPVEGGAADQAVSFDYEDTERIASGVYSGFYGDLALVTPARGGGGTGRQPLHPRYRQQPNRRPGPIREPVAHDRQHLFSGGRRERRMRRPRRQRAPGSRRRAVQGALGGRSGRRRNCFRCRYLERAHSGL